MHPILCIIQALSHLEINYKAYIGPGLLIMHHNAGVVISGRSTIGKNLSLVGGYIIGIRTDSSNLGTIIIGDDVSVGANCVIVGPIKIGNNVKCGASACVISDVFDDCTVVGVPARIIKHHT